MIILACVFLTSNLIHLYQVNLTEYRVVFHHSTIDKGKVQDIPGEVGIYFDMVQ